MNSSLNYDLLKQAQAHLKTAAEPGSLPLGRSQVPKAQFDQMRQQQLQRNPQPQSMLQNVLAQGGGNGWKAPGTVPAVSYNTGAGAPAEPIAAKPPVATQSGPKPANGWRQATMIPDMSVTSGNGAVAAPKPAAPVAPKPVSPANTQLVAMQKSQPEMHPSDQAKAIFAQVNQRRRDAAFGRGTFSAAEEKSMMDQGNKLLNQSNTMRNAPGYKPDVKSMHPRDQADRLRIQLNQQRSAAGGEVAQAPQVMRRLNQFNAAADAMPAPKMPGNMRIPGKPQQMPAGPMPSMPKQQDTPGPMFAKLSAANQFVMFGAYIGQLAR